ncbi:winged helix-turn-helix domain-containing protein [Halococcus sp. IIIV-5B]|nr:winged helix-turn-helix domain-containing protein [Halococcus sp. IIIV-5B]
MPEDHEDGRRKYGDQEFLEAIQEAENPTTGDIARTVGCTSQAALYRLNLLEDEGRVSSMKVGAAKVWSVS